MSGVDVGTMDAAYLVQSASLSLLLLAFLAPTEEEAWLGQSKVLFGRGSRFALEVPCTTHTSQSAVLS